MPEGPKEESAVKPTEVRLGVIQFGDERNLTPVVCLDCPDIESAQQLADLLLKLQNGSRTMAVQEHHFSAGDLAIKIQVDRHPLRPKEAVLAVVCVKQDETHLTDAFYAASTVEKDAAEVFRFMNTTLRNCMLTVAVGGQPCCDLLYLLKYNLVWRSPIEAGPP